MYSCSNCGYQSVKWLGRCPECGEWDSFQEIRVASARKDEPLLRPVTLSQLENLSLERISTGLSEFDNVLGGGILEGEAVLLGGEPGIGKSTLLLEVAAYLSKRNKVFYVSAEEASSHIGMRAKRLKLDDINNIYVAEAIDVDSIVELAKKEQFKVVIVDSIQAVKTSRVGAAAGSLGQIRESASVLIQAAKTMKFSLFLIGHITKEGMLAGPKVLEHMVDCVIYFEGERNSELRVLRAVKNRFGSVGEIGVFKMSAAGIYPAEDASAFFISSERTPASGCCLTCVTEGCRSIFLEIQSLVTRADFTIAKRKVSGVDFNRFSVLLAMLEKQLHLNLSHKDIFVNISGGIKIKDAAADLALAVAIVSAYRDKPVSSDYVFLGELGLGGELRRISHIEARIRAAQKLGFKKVFIPQANGVLLDRYSGAIEVQPESSFISVIKNLGL
ncbi:MAG: DNA repair protein RadA [Candidatus Omnitrophica bacterium]|nr:DNA repair protein RadA [Candidatus Omnitrophota bacterium]